MLSFSAKTALVLVLLQSVSVWALLHDITLEGGEGAHWDYSNGAHGPAHWHELNPEWAICKTGQQQSPISITLNDMVSDPELGAVVVSRDSEGIPANIVNNGHAVNVEVTSSGNFGRMSIDSWTHYYLEQFHYHMPSEHRIMNQSFPLEVHMVYRRTKSSRVGSKTAVVSFLFLEGNDSKFLAQFVDTLPSYKTPNIKTSIGNIMLPEMAKSYGRYLGSLTTPPCTQDVLWTINMWNFPTVSKPQLQKLRAALSSNNSRPTFSSSGRGFRTWP